MAAQGGKRWTRSELLAVLTLYCQIPFGQMHTRNQHVQQLALQLDRTASAIALKLVNFASLDSAHRDRGVAGMSNVSRLDREVWDEYGHQWHLLAEHAFNRPDQNQELHPPTTKKAVTFDATQECTEAWTTVSVRRRQSFFRNVVLAAYCNRCCITRIGAPALLRASHIVPWAESIENRVNPMNGLCLNALHDAAFDRGFITLDEDRRLVVGCGTAEAMPSDVFHHNFRRYEGHPIALPERYGPGEEFLAHHRNNVFVG